MNQYKFAGVLTVALMLPISGFASNTGRITRVVPDAVVVNAADSTPAANGAALKVQDEIQTTSGSVEMTMADASKFAIPANSSFKIEEYSDRTQASPGRAIFSLLRGGFRTVSGLIGKAKGDTYEMKTPVVTMGIRGTDYAAVMKAGGSVKHPDGLYATVVNGRIFLKNAAGTLDLNKGETAYVRDANTAPVLVKDVEDVFNAAGLSLNPDFGAALNVDLHNLHIDGRISSPRINQSVPSRQIPPVVPPRTPPPSPS